MTSWRERLRGLVSAPALLQVEHDHPRLALPGRHTRVRVRAVGVGRLRVGDERRWVFGAFDEVIVVGGPRAGGARVLDVRYAAIGPGARRRIRLFTPLRERPATLGVPRADPRVVDGGAPPEVTLPATAPPPPCAAEVPRAIVAASLTAAEGPRPRLPRPRAQLGPSPRGPRVRLLLPDVDERAMSTEVSTSLAVEKTA